MSFIDIARRLPSLSFGEAGLLLPESGWNLIGTGDWSLTYGNEENGVALRISPFDPAFRLFAETQLDRPADDFIAVHEVISMRGHAYAVRMPLAATMEEQEAKEFINSLPNSTKRWLKKLVAAAEGTLSHFGGADIHPGNVICTDRPVLTDPIYLDGPRIRQDLLEDPAGLRTKFSRSELKAFCDLPFFAIGGEGSHYRESLLETLAGSDLP